MRKSVAEQLVSLAEEGAAAESNLAIRLWAKKAHSFLGVAVGEAEATEFHRLENPDEWSRHAMKLGYVQGLAAIAVDESDPARPLDVGVNSLQPAATAAGQGGRTRVFVVHGHEESAKEATARFLEKLNLQPVILHEQPSGGRTIIEKSERYSGDVAFAVVLLTPDDVGAIAAKSQELRPRARQNVVLELGYFMGRLTRDRVCALYKGGVELPSDIQGVVYVEMDDGGAWKAKLAQEFVQAKLPINPEGLLGG